MKTFSQFKSLGDALKEFRIHYQEKIFDRVQNVPAPITLKEEIAFNLKEMAYDASEAIICESLIFPILRAAWKPFIKNLMLWSHTSISYNDTLSGIPDYMFAKQSELGKVVVGLPFIAIVEAKKDDFTGGWGQCAAELYAAQKINENADLEVFGIVSNGLYWQFAALQQHTFTKYSPTFEIENLDELWAMLYSVLDICKEQLNCLD